MKQFIVFVTLYLGVTSVFAHPQDGMSPNDLMIYYIKVFNEENISALEDVYHFPHVRIVNGKLIPFPSKDTPVVDFSNLNKTAWKYSKINQVTVIAEGANSALVEMDLSRYDKEDKAFLRSSFFYVLTKDAGYWQILSLNSIGSVAGVK